MGALAALDLNIMAGEMPFCTQLLMGDLFFIVMFLGFLYILGAVSL